MGNSNLHTVLDSFEGADGDITKLEKEFRRLAEYFLYGGYISVNETTKVYLRDIEFYYHEEEGAIKDPIMYHRNTKNNSDVKYYKLGHLNAHVSGVDITLENDNKKYRDAILIRGFHFLGDKFVSTLPDDYEQHSTYI